MRDEGDSGQDTLMEPPAQAQEAAGHDAIRGDDGRMGLSKFASRKFVISAAAFLASLGGGLMGYFTGNEAIATVGIVCMCVSAALYAAAEAYVDGKAAASSTTETLISASTTDKGIVQGAISK